MKDTKIFERCLTCPFYRAKCKDNTDYCRKTHKDCNELYKLTGLSK